MNRRYVSASVAALALMFANVAAAVVVRGRVDSVGSFGSAPMPNATVELCLLANGGCLQSRTGGDGMYYFPSALPGPHRLVVNGRERLQVNIPDTAYFDVTPVMGN
jgi:hypothetical protein